MKFIFSMLLFVVLLLPMSADTDQRNAAWDPAHESNYTKGRQGDQVKYVVIHIVQGSYSGCISWFKNSAANVSAHYVVSNGGSITQMVNEANTAWHAGNWTYNKRSIGIEHEGYVTNKSFPDAMYRNSANLVRAICNRHGIPKDRAHIIGHNEVPGATHTDPGKNWDWNKFMGYVKNGVEFAETFANEEETIEYKGDIKKVTFATKEFAQVVAPYENTTVVAKDIIEGSVDATIISNMSSFDCKNHIPHYDAEQTFEFTNYSQNNKNLFFYYDVYNIEVWEKQPGQEWQKIGYTTMKKFKGYNLED